MPPHRTRHRASGWTPARQAAFLDALGELGSVERAAVVVGLSASSAHRLRKQPRGAEFAAAWDAVLDTREARLIDELMTRIADRKTPQYYRGRVVGERVVTNNRLLLSVLGRTMRPRVDIGEDAAYAGYIAAMDQFEASLKFTESTESATIP